MTSDQRKFERLAALCDTLAQSASAPEERELFSIWPTSGGRWRPVQKFTRFLRETPTLRGHRVAALRR
jgi:hypothetical protein